jgi:hypothetical protein
MTDLLKSGEPAPSPVSLLDVEAAALASLPPEPLDFLDADRGANAVGLITLQRAARLMAVRPLACEAAINKLACRGQSLPSRDAAAALFALITCGAVPVHAEVTPGRWAPTDSRLALILTSAGELIGVVPDPMRVGIASRCAVPAAPFVGGMLDSLEEERRSAQERAQAEAAWHAQRRAQGDEHARYQRAMEEKLRAQGEAHRQALAEQDAQRERRLPDLAAQLAAAEARAAKGA